MIVSKTLNQVYYRYLISHKKELFVDNRKASKDDRELIPVSLIAGWKTVSYKNKNYIVPIL